MKQEFRCLIQKCYASLFQELKGGKAYAKVNSSHYCVVQPPSLHQSSRSPRFTVIGHICADSHVSPEHTDGLHCLQVGSSGHLVSLFHRLQVIMNWARYISSRRAKKPFSLFLLPACRWRKQNRVALMFLTAVVSHLEIVIMLTGRKNICPPLEKTVLTTQCHFSPSAWFCRLESSRVCRLREYNSQMSAGRLRYQKYPPG